MEKRYFLLLKWAKLKDYSAYRECEYLYQLVPNRVLLMDFFEWSNFSRNKLEVRVPFQVFPVKSLSVTIGKRPIDGIVIEKNKIEPRITRSNRKTSFSLKVRFWSKMRSEILFKIYILQFNFKVFFFLLRFWYQI